MKTRNVGLLLKQQAASTHSNVGIPLAGTLIPTTGTMIAERKTQISGLIARRNVLAKGEKPLSTGRLA